MRIASIALTLLLCASPALAHFGTLIPSDDIVTQHDSRTVHLDLKFMHPMEGQYMEMAKPEKFGVVHNGKNADLTDTVHSAKASGLEQGGEFTYWTADYTIRRPGDYSFYMVPAPYWEPAEDLFIKHYTKVCVNAFGMQKGWDQPVGLETEIMPLTRPYGLWTNNLFTGKVLLKGEPVPFAEVEVEYLNESPGNISFIHPPSSPYVTQVVKADKNGVFSFAMPKAGWWGFSALSQADWTLKHNGEEKNVEIGAVYWVHTIDME
jgi:cobalt/nickel transport protein